MAAFARNLARSFSRDTTVAERLRRAGIVPPSTALAPPPEPPARDTAAETEAASRRRRRSLLNPRRADLLTGPSGLSGPAPTERAKLLGH